MRNRNPIPSIVDYCMKNPQKSKFHRSIAGLLDANIISLVSTVNYDMSRSETVIFTAVCVRIWSFHGTYSTGNTSSIRLYTARQHTAVIRRIRNGCSTARLRSYCNVHERSRRSERLDTVVYERRNDRPGLSLVSLCFMWCFGNRIVFSKNRYIQMKSLVLLHRKSILMDLLILRHRTKI